MHSKNFDIQDHWILIKTHLNANVGITPKAIIVISTTLDVVISVNKAMNGVNSLPKETSLPQKKKKSLPLKNGTQLNKGIDSPNCWAHHSAPFQDRKHKRFKKKEGIVSEKEGFCLKSFTNNGCEEVTTVYKCKTFCRTIDYWKSKYIGKIAKWHKREVN